MLVAQNITMEMSIEERIQQLEANSGGFDICDLLEKHFFQRNGQDPISGEPWGENDKTGLQSWGKSAWVINTKPTFPSTKARTLACLITFHLYSN